MFRTAELGRKVSKADYRARKPALREALLAAQYSLREADFPVVVLFAGVDGAGKSESANRLLKWMDPRWITTLAFDEPTQEERERPEQWRYWRALPPKGEIGIFLSAWYHQPLLARVYGGSEVALDESLDEIAAFERMLADDGALVLKFWMHLGRKEQRARLRALESDPLQSWRVTERDWKHWRRYGDFIDAAEHIVTRTSHGHAPWHLIEGTDSRYRSLRVGQLLVEAMQRRLGSAEEPAEAPAPPVLAPSAGSASPIAPLPAQQTTVLSSLDMSERLEKKEYKELLRRYQGRLGVLQREARERGRSMVLVFEGWDAAGKGGTIHRITRAIDARSVRVIPIAAPSDEERAHHYLWRFWRHLPRAGRVAIFDRSWYGRVLVERVEGFASEAEWRRAYSEINHFERALEDHGIVLLKFWIHITPDEQMKRFEEREKTPYKRWKLTEDDVRNRERWSDYEMAVHDMVQRTSPKTAPWVLVEGNDKRHARVVVIRCVTEALKEALA